MSIEQDLAVLKDYRKEHQREHSEVAGEIRELRETLDKRFDQVWETRENDRRETQGTLNRILLAVMGLALTFAAGAVGYTVSHLGG